MKIIFLDIDGVICTHRMHVSGLAKKYRGDGLVKDGDAWMTDFDPVSCGLLLRICQEHENVKIVLSSYWRLFDKDYDLFLARLETYCPELIGYLLMPTEEYPEMYRTPDLINGRRDWEISTWLQRYSSVLGVDNYVIIDDEDFRDKINETHKGHFVKCDMYDGFGFSDFLKCEEIFGADAGNDKNNAEIG